MNLTVEGPLYLGCIQQLCVCKLLIIITVQILHYSCVFSSLRSHLQTCLSPSILSPLLNTVLISVLDIALPFLT